MSDPAADRTNLSHLRHELRTPINHIVGYSELLIEETGDAGHAAYAADLLEKIRRAGQYAAQPDQRQPHRRAPGRSPEEIDPEPGAAARFSRPRIPARLLTPLRRRVHRIPRWSRPKSWPPFPGTYSSSTTTRRPTRDMLARQLDAPGPHRRLRRALRSAALDVLRATPVDLVLLDMMMPVLDGYGTLLEIKRDPALRHLPVIMISPPSTKFAGRRPLHRARRRGLSPEALQPDPPACPHRRRPRKEAFPRPGAPLRQDHRGYPGAPEGRAHRSGKLRALHPPAAAQRRAPITTGIGASSTPPELGGDFFGYYWIDAQHLALYLLDVCGHGVGPARLSVTAKNGLRHEALPSVDFRDPGAMLTVLNPEAFLMEKQNDMYFTIWYGVWQPATRTLRFATAGHPPALLVTPQAGAARVELLKGAGLVLGGMEGVKYRTFERQIPGPERLTTLSARRHVRNHATRRFDA